MMGDHSIASVFWTSAALDSIESASHCSERTGQVKMRIATCIPQRHVRSWRKEIYGQGKKQSNEAKRLPTTNQKSMHVTTHKGWSPILHR